MTRLLFTKYYITTFLIIGLLIAGICGCVKEKTDKNSSHNTATIKKGKTGLSQEVEKILFKKITLIQDLAGDSTIICLIREANRKNQKISIEEIKKLDDAWIQAAGINEFIKSHLTNKCAQLLVDFQETHDEFTEIFITDKKGLNVGQTNKTTDYYQADEEWWIRAYNNGIGKSYHGDSEYDESSKTECVAVYVPVMDPEINEAIGIVKAVCDITSIKLEL